VTGSAAERGSIATGARPGRRSGHSVTRSAAE
jgi:hypothetical protein